MKRTCVVWRGEDEILIGACRTYGWVQQPSWDNFLLVMRVVAEPTVVALQLLETPPGRLMQLWGNARDGLLGRMRDFPILFWPS